MAEELKKLNKKFEQIWKKIKSAVNNQHKLLFYGVFLMGYNENSGMPQLVK